MSKASEMVDKLNLLKLIINDSIRAQVNEDGAFMLIQGGYQNYIRLTPGEALSLGEWLVAMYSEET